MNTAVDKKLESDTFKDILGEVLGMDKVEYATILDELWNAYNTYYKSEQVDLDLIPQLIIGKKGADGKELTPEFNKQFAGYLKIIANPDNTTGIKTLVDFNRAREEYRQTMLYYGLNDLATNENIDKFIEGNVSPIEAQTRMEAAFSAVESADSILRSQLGDLNLTGKELARGLLLGKEGAIALENRIKTANVMAGEVQAGIRSQLGAGDLARQGVSRNQAAQGLSRTKEQLSGYEQEAKRQGQDASSIQSELEKENVLGMASQRRKKLQQSGVARFSGTSGTMQGSLKKNSARSN
jgi:hypothetical protein